MRLVKDFVGDPVADAGRERLIQQHRLDRRRPLAQEDGELGERRQLPEGVEAEQADGWLVILGQTALMLYFVHQVIELTLVSQRLGLRFNHWALYWAGNVLLIVLMVGLGWGWLQLKRRVRQRWTAGTQAVVRPPSVT